VVGVSLLGAIGYLLNLLTSSSPARLERLADATDANPRDHRSHGIEPSREYGLSLASIPWTRNSIDPAATEVERAVQPFVHRTGARAAVPLAFLPPLRPRHDLARPTAATVAAAEVPWRRFATPAEIARQSPVAVPASDLPAIKARHNPARPTDALLKPAEVPWSRLTSIAEVKHIELAEMPRFAAKRNPAQPDRVMLSPASLPWDRDTQSSLPAHVSAAKVPPALKSAVPK
jgi:hypothetical protein